VNKSVEIDEQKDGETDLRKVVLQLARLLPWFTANSEGNIAGCL
jgi:hypothetical protein